MMAIGNDAVSSCVRRFSYGSETGDWWRYLLVFLGLVIAYVILLSTGYQPLHDIWFPIVIGFVLLDIAANVVLRLKAPRRFSIKGQILTIEWVGRSVEVPLAEVAVRKGLTALLNSGTVLNAGKSTFSVFENLNDYRDFLEICAANASSSEDPKPVGQG
jgi:hypothetical protein